MEIKKMELADLEKIKEELTQEFDDFWNYNILKKELLIENTYYIYAENEQEILGFAGMQMVLDEADITNIVTRKKARNKGIASKMLNTLIEFAKQKNIKKIHLEVNENNVYAIKLYKKFKFEKVGERKKYYNSKDTAILMTLNVTVQ